MAWIESNQELGRHPKTKKLARLLSLSLPAAVGHLQFFWWWALDFAQDGDLSKYDSADIADAVLWEGDPDQLVDSMIRAGFIDRQGETLVIHEWEKYAGRLMAKRRSDAERKRNSRNPGSVSADDCTDVHDVSDGRPPDGAGNTNTNRNTYSNPISSTGECKGECEGEAERGALPPPAGKKAKKIKRGQYGWVSLTDEEYQKLLRDLGETELERCIAYIDESAQATGNKNKWRDWNLVIRKCHREQWGIRGGGQTAPAQAAPKAGVGSDMILAKFMQEGINS